MKKIPKAKRRPDRKAATKKRKPRAQSTSQEAASRFPHLVLATIQEPIEPFDRGEKYEDPLDAMLRKKKIGSVTGGGTKLNSRFEAVSADVEVELADLDGSLEFVRDALTKLGAPKGSKIQFMQSGKMKRIAFGK